MNTDKLITAQDLQRRIAISTGILPPISFCARIIIKLQDRE